MPPKTDKQRRYMAMLCHGDPSKVRNKDAPSRSTACEILHGESKGPKKRKGVVGRY